ncbi:MAG: multicopper oxidase family protein [Alphaproteobacteria bacterium]|nr:MAG: multicopper oxidase family protein [Alphaproteobacteria bacterium]
MITRREFMMGTGASALGLLGVAGPRAAMAEGSGPPILRAREVPVRLLPDDYPETRLWSFADATPGQTLRLKQGARLVRRLVNDLPAATSVHWHGIRIDNAMDGVAGLTQDPVEPGGSFDYDFVLPDAGTWWYHAHTRSHEQVARGLYGALIVDEAEPPEVDRDEVLVLDDWRLNPRDGQIDPDFANMHDLSHGGRLGNFVTTNGRHDLTLEVRRHERLRLRLINAANARIFVLALAGLDGWIMAHDGMPLPRPEPVGNVVILAPAQRVDLIVDVVADEGESAHVVRIERNDGFSQVELRVTGVESRARRSAPGPLPQNPRMEVPGIEGARRLRLVMEGGAMGRMDAAILDGRRQSFRDIAQAGRFWAFNGVVGMTEAPLAELARGETARIEIVNDTVFPHAMHLHGMHVREILPDGALGPLRDTILVSRGEIREIAFLADNPGDWLLHCHMLAHAAAGMTTWLRVA